MWLHIFCLVEDLCSVIDGVNAANMLSAFGVPILESEDNTANLLQGTLPAIGALAAFTQCNYYFSILLLHNFYFPTFITVQWPHERRSIKIVENMISIPISK